MACITLDITRSYCLITAVAVSLFYIDIVLTLSFQAGTIYLTISLMIISLAPYRDSSRHL